MAALTSFGFLLIAAAAWYVATDPFQHSVGNGVKHFEPQYIAAPTYDILQNFSRDTDSKLQKAELKWRGEFWGPESVTFDARGRGPYTGISDGRVMRYDGPELGWSTFAYTSRNRSDICTPKTPPAPDLAHEHICGRPLGLRFEKKTGNLWIADAYFGILKVGPEGGQAEPVITEIDGIPMRFSNDLDFDEDGVLYFTDSSTKWSRRQFFLSILEAEDTGRFLKYDPKTKEPTVLIKNLRFPNGVAVSKDGSFVVLCETRGGRLLRYWLKGEKKGTHEMFALLPGWPDNVRRNPNGDFWVAIHALRTTGDMYFGMFPWLRYLAVRFPVPQKYLYKLFTGRLHAMVIRYGPDGSIKEVLEDQTGKVVQFVSEVEEHDGKLYLGSVLLPHLAVYTIPTSSDS
ncbi:unnamed protein product [Sphagnum troendelagicum]|uniref:Strictosidine synthase conserved region domain-containing protein n=1 Tax=Sphagnum troendelagicum TaxID=128251 RepID=A0ABP0TBL3_9BRYO